MVWDNAGSSDACNVAIAIFELDASTPNVRAPSRARLYYALCQLQTMK